MHQLPSILHALILSFALLALSACAGPGATGATHATAQTQLAPHPPARGAPEGGEAKIHAERIPVIFGDVKKLASVLRDVLDVEGPKAGPIRAILVDEPTGDLVVVGTDEGIAAARRLLGPVCEQPTEVGVETEVVPLIHAAAADVAHAVRPTAGKGVKVIVDAPTNSIIVQALAEDRERIRRVIAALDVESKMP